MDEHCDYTFLHIFCKLVSVLKHYLEMYHLLKPFSFLENKESPIFSSLSLSLLYLMAYVFAYLQQAVDYPCCNKTSEVSDWLLNKAK